MMLRRVGVGAHQQKAPIGEMRARRPYLLAVDQEMVALVDRASAQAGKIGARPRLGVALAPDLAAAEDLWKVPLLLRLGAPMNERGAEKTHADRDRKSTRLNSSHIPL